MKISFLLVALFFISTSSHGDMINLTCKVSGYLKTINESQELEPKNAILNVKIENEINSIYIDADGPVDYAFGLLHPARNNYQSENLSDKTKWNLVLFNKSTKTESTLNIDRLSGSISYYTYFPKTTSSVSWSGMCEKLLNSKPKF